MLKNRYLVLTRRDSAARAQEESPEEIDFLNDPYAMEDDWITPCQF
jgi:hypothetical protein